MQIHCPNFRKAFECERSNHDSTHHRLLSLDRRIAGDYVTSARDGLLEGVGQVLGILSVVKVALAGVSDLLDLGLLLWYDGQADDLKALQVDATEERLGFCRRVAMARLH